MSPKKLKLSKLNLNQLDNVSGGFKNTIAESYSYGETIKCPNCGNANWEEFTGESDPELQKDQFTCLKCGQVIYAAAGYGITDVL